MLLPEYGGQQLKLEGKECEERRERGEGEKRSLFALSFLFLTRPLSPPLSPSLRYILYRDDELLGVLMD